MKHYGRLIDERSPYIICPFLEHSNGQERSGSFKYYPETNTFWCFGCKSGRTPSDFVAQIEDISVTKAAYKILESFYSEVLASSIDVEFEQANNYNERLAIMIDMSNFIRASIQSNMPQMSQVEEIAEALDKMLDKYTMDNATLQKLISKLKEKLTSNG